MRTGATSQVLCSPNGVENSGKGVRTKPVLKISWHTVNPFIRLWTIPPSNAVISESADELEPHGLVTISPLAPENVFSSCHERGTKNKFWVPMRNRTWNLRIPRSDALPLSHRGSTVSEVYYEVHMTSVMHTAGISNVDSVMFVDRNKSKLFRNLLPPILINFKYALFSGALIMQIIIGLCL